MCIYIMWNIYKYISMGAYGCPVCTWVCMYVWGAYEYPVCV